MEDKRSYPFFNQSGGGSVAAISPERHFGRGGNNPDDFKLAAVVAAASASAAGGDDEDSELKSDAESSLPAAAECECVEDFLSREGTRRKLAILARLVGVDGADPAAVLAEVVRVLKDLDAKSRDDQCLLSQGLVRFAS